jgi:hypothetical protein
MNNPSTPDLVRWGSDKPDSLFVGVHGFAGGVDDYRLLGKELCELDSGLQVVSYDRIRNPSLKPPNTVGTGAIQANGAELLMVLGELAQNDATSKIKLSGHSLGGPIVASAYDMVYSDNLPAELANEQLRLAQILDHVDLSLIAPAGFTDAYAIMPTSGFAVHSLAAAIYGGAKGIVSDSENFSEIWNQRQRASRALGYIAKVRFSLEESIDACGPQTMQTLASIEPSRIHVVAYEDDEIFPAEKILNTLRNPSIMDRDLAIYQGLLKLNPREIGKFLGLAESVTDVAATIGFRAISAFMSADQPILDLAESARNNLVTLAEERTTVLAGNHTTPLTKSGAGELASALNNGGLNLAA